ncbi:MAG: hypothetical protein PHO30_05895 [Candidatus Omnitrophica bacterium]|nr:hypothetical protein [Candidatus Omnitrophota bacterium]
MEKKVKHTIIAAVLIVVAVTLYMLPLLLNLDNGITLWQKNRVSIWYQNCLDSFFYYDTIAGDHGWPFWGYCFEGGILVLSIPDEIVFHPLSPLILAVGAVKGMNLVYYIMYIFGGLSMFYLTSRVLKYDWAGSVYSSLVFVLCGFFPLLQVYGFGNARETILIPLLTAFYLRSVYSNAFILPAALILSLFCIQSALYFPIVVLFLFILALVTMFYKDTRLRVRHRNLRVFFIILALALGFSAFKLLPILEFLAIDNGSRGGAYPDSIASASSFPFLLECLVKPVNSGTGTMYIGYLPLLAGIVSGIVLWKRLWRWLFILLIFIGLSFGPHAGIDLHRILWHLPIFNAIDELAKYYSLIVIFIICLLAGRVFPIIRRYLPGKPGYAVGGTLMVISVVNLLTVNSAYFNEYKTKIPERKNGEQRFVQAGLINYHSGDDGAMSLLALSLYRENIGILNQDYDRYTPQINNNNIVPRYYLIPRFVFLAPSTKLICLPNPAYQGESSFLRPENKAELIRVTADSLAVRVTMTGKDRLVINQNYSRWWRSSAGKLENYKGRLSVRLDSVGSRIVSLDFRPGNFYLGGAISLFTLFFSVYFLYRPGKPPHIGRGENAVMV